MKRGRNSPDVVDSPAKRKVGNKGLNKPRDENPPTKPALSTARTLLAFILVILPKDRKDNGKLKEPDLKEKLANTINHNPSTYEIIRTGIGFEIRTTSQALVTQIKKFTNIGGIGVTIRTNTNMVKGVIKNIPLDWNTDSLLNNPQIHSAQRHQNKRKENTKTVVITFIGKLLPNTLLFNNIKYTVYNYIPNPIRCYNCQIFGHLAHNCKRKPVCAKCSGGHKTSDCTDTKRKCSNCLGDHSAAYKNCPKYQQVHKNIQQKIENTEHRSYRDAVLNRIPAPANLITPQDNQDKILVSKQDLVAFIAQVMIGKLDQNLDEQLKTEHISSVSRLVTKAAKDHLHVEVEPQTVFKKIVNTNKLSEPDQANSTELAETAATPTPTTPKITGKKICRKNLTGKLKDDNLPKLAPPRQRSQSEHNRPLPQLTVQEDVH